MVDQIDRFHDSEMVAAMLARIAARAHEAVVVNADDAYLERLAGNVRPECRGAPFRRLRRGARRLAAGPRLHRDDARAARARHGVVVERGRRRRRRCSTTAGHPSSIGLPARGMHYAVDAAAAYSRRGRCWATRFSTRDRRRRAERDPGGVRPRRARRAFAVTTSSSCSCRTPRATSSTSTASTPGTEQVLFAIGSDVRDPSYFWPTDASSLGRVSIVSGSKAAEAALMLAYDGVEIDRVEPDLGTGGRRLPRGAGARVGRQDHRLLRRRHAPHPSPPRTRGSGMTLTIVSLLPRLQNTNGDAENAAVLAAASPMGGLDAEVVAGRASRPTCRPGSTRSSSARATTRRSKRRATCCSDPRRAAHAGAPRAFRSSRSAPAGSCSAGASSVATAESSRASASCPGARCRATSRVTGDVVVASPRFGTLVGFENHARDYVGAEGSPLGRVALGHGNGRDSGQEGVVMGDVIGTHLHGPVLAKNPAFADRLLASMAVTRRASSTRAASEPPSSTPTRRRHGRRSCRRRRRDGRRRRLASSGSARLRRDDERPGRAGAFVVRSRRVSAVVGEQALDSSCQLCAICESFSWCLRPWWAQNSSSPLATTTRM